MNNKEQKSASNAPNGNTATVTSSVA